MATVENMSVAGGEAEQAGMEHVQFAVVGLGSGHAFKFAPTIGLVLAELAISGRAAADLSLFRPDRPALRTAMASSA